MFCAARPRSNAIDNGAFGAFGSGVTSAIAAAAPAMCPAVGPTAASASQMGLVAAHDERPALQVLAAPRTPARAQDPFEVVRLEGTVFECADGPDRRDRRPDRVVPLGCHRSPTGVRVIPPGPAIAAVSGSGRGGRVAPGARPGRAFAGRRPSRRWRRRAPRLRAAVRPGSLPQARPRWTDRTVRRAPGRGSRATAAR